MLDAVSCFRAIVEDDAHLSVGDLVVVYWTSGLRRCACLSRVTRLTVRRVTVTLARAIDEYPEGSTVVASRLPDRTQWGYHNCVLRPEVAQIAGWCPDREDQAILEAERIGTRE